MIVLCSNHSSRAFIALAQQTKRLGWMIGPTHFKRPRVDIPFALDNDAYIHFQKQTTWNSQTWFRFLEKVGDCGLTPLWAAIPDVVTDRDETLKKWARYKHFVQACGWPLAFVVQDGMTPGDVPAEADVVFVGGSTEWKWRTLGIWTQHFPHVHLGRCGTSREKLERIEELGCKSCDGSGFFRATINGQEARNLKAYLAADKHQQIKLL